MDENSDEYKKAREAGLPFYIKPPEQGRTYNKEELTFHQDYEMPKEARMFIALSELSDQFSAIARVRNYNRIQTVEYNILNICKKFNIKPIGYKGEEIYNGELELEDYLSKLDSSACEIKKGEEFNFEELIQFEPVDSEEVSLEQTLAISYIYDIMNKVYWQNEKSQKNQDIALYGKSPVDKELKKSMEFITGKGNGKNFIKDYCGSPVFSEDNKTNRPASNLTMQQISDILKALFTGKYKGKTITREGIEKLLEGKNPFARNSGICRG